MEEIPVDNRVVDYNKLLHLGIEKIQYEKFREKGIDVKLATDLIVGAIDNKYDIAIVVSSDTDIIPAIDWVRHRIKKSIEYIGFSIVDENNDKRSTKPSITLISKTDSQRVLTPYDLEPFIIKQKTIPVHPKRTVKYFISY